jgi:hypothetical protein
MADVHPLFNLPAAPPATCNRCGRLFEAAVTVKDDDGTERRIPGHVQGDPVLCVPLPTMPELIERDARRRRDKRRGRAPK